MVEVTHHIDVGSIRSPFSQHPAAFGGAVQAIVEMCLSKVLELSRTIGEVFKLLQSVVMPALNSLGERFQPGVVLD